MSHKKKPAVLTWVPLLKGQLALTYRPGLGRVAETFGTDPNTVVVTLLSDKEGAQDIGAAVQKLGLYWRHLPILHLFNDVSNVQADVAALRRGLADLSLYLERPSSRVVFHCAAGIHRTGTMGYALARTCGLSKIAAAQLVGKARTKSLEGLTPERRWWAETQLLGNVER